MDDDGIDNFRWMDYFDQQVYTPPPPNQDLSIVKLDDSDIFIVENNKSHKSICSSTPIAAARIDQTKNQNGTILIDDDDNDEINRTLSPIYFDDQPNISTIAITTIDVNDCLLSTANNDSIIDIQQNAASRIGAENLSISQQIAKVIKKRATKIAIKKSCATSSGTTDELISKSPRKRRRKWPNTNKNRLLKGSDEAAIESNNGGESVSKFHGVYCLVSKSVESKYQNRCYIGYTVNPNRRLRQHNRGRQFGGAKKTNNRGPWDMVCIVHGFCDSVSALQFEWAWQHPLRSRRLCKLHLRKTSKETHLSYAFRIVSNMLNIDPWQSTALTFRWLMPIYEQLFVPPLSLPIHMKLAYGCIIDDDQTICLFCDQLIDMTINHSTCYCSVCNSMFHLICVTNRIEITNNGICCTKCTGEIVFR